MAKSSMRIGLVDPIGDVLFSGDSLIATAVSASAPARAPVDVDEDDLCPATQRSVGSEDAEGSGYYRAVDRRSWSPDVPPVTVETRVNVPPARDINDEGGLEAEPPTAKRTAA